MMERKVFFSRQNNSFFKITGKEFLKYVEKRCNKKFLVGVVEFTEMSSSNKFKKLRLGRVLTFQWHWRNMPLVNKKSK